MMTSKAERKRRRAKRASITLPGGDIAPQRPTGRDRRHTNQPEDAMQTVIDARAKRAPLLSDAEVRKAAAALERAKQMEHPADRAKAVRAVAKQVEDAKHVHARQPICGTDMGLCIRALTKGDERAALADAWATLSAAHRNYRLLIIGQTGDPQGAAIPMLPEPMETDPSLRVDLRTHEQRIEAAKRAWHEWWTKIKALPVPNLRWAINGALDGFMGDGALWRDRQPTATGKAAVQALRMMVA